MREKFLSEITRLACIATAPTVFYRLQTVFLLTFHLAYQLSYQQTKKNKTLANLSIRFFIRIPIYTTITM